MKLKKSIIVAASMLSTLSVSAQSASFYVVTPNKAKAALLDKVSVSLGAFALPAGKVGTVYPAFDFNALLQVNGDPNFTGGGVVWHATPPAGLSLSNAGILSGTPSEVNEGGSSFQVQATYKTKAGQQSYTIVVKDVVLHVTQVSVGATTCAVTLDGELKCWGNNSAGQLGNSTGVNSSVPVTISGLPEKVTTVATNSGHVCAIGVSGYAYCWGGNSWGQLGNGNSTNSAVPVRVSTLSGVASISAGANHTCAVTLMGGAYCWGLNNKGQLGTGTVNVQTPQPVVGASAGVLKTVATQSSTCALMSGGTVKCWGDNTYGQLGDGTQTSSLVPVDVPGLTGVSKLVGGGFGACALNTSVKCWGRTPEMTNLPVPTEASGLPAGIADVVMSGTARCVLYPAGQAKCWGFNAYGQLGDGTNTDSYTAPVDVQSLVSFTKIIGGFAGFCGVDANSILRCWGYNNYGQLGDGTNTSRSTPTPVVAP